MDGLPVTVSTRLGVFACAHASSASRSAESRPPAAFVTTVGISSREGNGGLGPPSVAHDLWPRFGYHATQPPTSPMTAAPQRETIPTRSYAARARLARRNAARFSAGVGGVLGAGAGTHDAARAGTGSPAGGALPAASRFLASTSTIFVSIVPSSLGLPPHPASVARPHLTIRDTATRTSADASTPGSSAPPAPTAAATIRLPASSRIAVRSGR